MPTLEVRPPQQQRSREAWNRVLDAGVAILEDGGYDAFTIAAVCERAAGGAARDLRPHDQQGRALPRRLRARHRRLRGGAAGLRRRGPLGRAGTGRRWSAPRWPRWSASRCATSAFLRAVVLISAAHAEVAAARVPATASELGERFARVVLRRRADADRARRSGGRGPGLLRSVFADDDHPGRLRAGVRERRTGDDDEFVDDMAEMAVRYLLAPLPPGDRPAGADRI